MFRSRDEISPKRSNFHLNRDRVTKLLPTTMILLVFLLTLTKICGILVSPHVI